ncbi:hypothetical protein [Sorangium sp. So ce1097]|uniref:hypothetical protein n=1 Tax=Sorangium sp. So ce1097 TaxID=3133330 RepID=UPI003F61BD3B
MEYSANPGAVAAKERDDHVKTVLKLLGALVGLVVVAVVVFWVGWLRAPAPEAVCEHMGELATKETGASAKKVWDQAACVKRMQPPEFGRLKYVKQMKCIVGAESMDGLKSCEKGG